LGYAASAQHSNQSAVRSSTLLLNFLNFRCSRRLFQETQKCRSSPMVKACTLIFTDGCSTTSSTLNGAENMGDDGGHVNWIKDLDIFQTTLIAMSSNVLAATCILLAISLSCEITSLPRMIVTKSLCCSNSALAFAQAEIIWSYSSTI